MSKTRNLADVASGTITGNLSFSDNEKAILGDGDDLQIYHNGSDSYVDDTGTGALILRGNSNVTIGKYTGETMGYFETDGAVSLYHDNAIKLATTATGVDVTGDITCDTSVLIEASSGFGSIEVGGPSGAFIDMKAPFSDDYDGRIQYDVGGTGSFVITTNSGNSSPVIIKQQNSEKLRTTSTGVDVTGNIVVSGTVDGVDLQTLNNAVTANTAKTGITSSQASAITANTAKTGITSSQASAITANTAKTTNATHSGEVTGSGALTIADNVVDEANLKVSNSPVNGYALTAQSGNTGGLTWATISSNPYTAQSTNATGYITLVGGLIIQWGKSGYIGTGGSSSVSFAITFPNACRTVAMSPHAASTSNSFGWASGAPSTSGVTFYSRGAVPASGIYYIAIGH